jgi:23S rRNA (guanosine2251-2'-O)-methyltransferase
MIKLNARELRTSEPNPVALTGLRKNDISIIVDNVLDTYNVGSIFRLADAVAAKKVYLCGETLTPPNSRIKKASVSTWKWVDWEHKASAGAAIRSIKDTDETTQVIAVEQHTSSIPIYDATYRLPLALIVGNETTGVSQEALREADLVIELPMWGVNKSLNVMVSLGIVLYDVMRGVRITK